MMTKEKLNKKENLVKRTAATMSTIIVAIVILVCNVFKEWRINIPVAIILVLIGIFVRIDKKKRIHAILLVLCGILSATMIYLINMINLILVDVICIAFLGFFVYWTIIEFIRMFQLKKEKKQKDMPYGLNVTYEMQTYKNVGKDYGDRHSANRGLFGNIKRYFRKKSNKGQRKYAFCNTYSDWREHVKQILPQEICNYDDMQGWLRQQLNYAKATLDDVKTLLIPIYVALIPIFIAFNDKANEVETDYSLDSVFYLFCILIILIPVSLSVTRTYSEEVLFYKDFIKLVDELNPNVQGQTENDTEKNDNINKCMCLLFVKNSVAEDQNESDTK